MEQYGLKKESIRLMAEEIIPELAQQHVEVLKIAQEFKNIVK